MTASQTSAAEVGCGFSHGGVGEQRDARSDLGKLLSLASGRGFEHVPVPVPELGVGSQPILSNTEAIAVNQHWNGAQQLSDAALIDDDRTMTRSTNPSVQRF